MLFRSGTAEQTLEELLERIRGNFQITESASEIHPRHKGEIVMYGSRRWYRLTVHEELYKNDPVDDLDVSILQNYILDPLFDIKDPKTDPRVQFVGGIRGIGELVRLTDGVADGESKTAGDPALRVAFAMYPTSMDELLAVADSGRLMPPKSTWFEPKLRSGLFIHMM